MTKLHSSIVGKKFARNCCDDAHVHFPNSKAEVGIFKRKQENKNSTKKAIKKTGTRPRKRPRKKEKLSFFSFS